MKHLLLVSHAALAQGIESALEMLLGARSYVFACGMLEDEGPEAFRAQLAKVVEPWGANDEVVLMADIAGGFPHKSALAVLEEKGLGEKVIAFGGANLPMAISAVMGIEDELDLDALRDAMLSEGAQAIKQL